MSDATYETSLKRTIDSLEHELEVKDKEIQNLRGQIEYKNDGIKNQQAKIEKLRDLVDKLTRELNAD